MFEFTLRTFSVMSLFVTMSAVKWSHLHRGVAALRVDVILMMVNGRGLESHTQLAMDVTHGEDLIISLSAIEITVTI